jgi:dolichol kinase
MIPATEPGAVLLVAVVCASILVLAEVLHRAFALEPEWTRKLAHVLMGLTAAAFPWLFREPRSVLLLCALFAGVLGASRALSGLPSIHRVGRRTEGALWFPVAVAWVFLAARGRVDLYVPPMLLLALADPAAAVVGRGRHTHRVRAGHPKTVEGSLAFFLVACECLLVASSLTMPLPASDLFACAVAIAGVLTAVEVVSPAGSDNFLVPVVAFLLLRATASDGAPVAVGVLSAAAALAVGFVQQAWWERAHA